MFLELGERIENFDCVHGEQHHKQNLPTYDQSWPKHQEVSDNQTMWSKLQPTNCLSVFDYVVGLARKGLGVNATLNHFSY